ncbi:MAG: peptidylprolyl isomerase [Candidatus Methanomethylicia archaeon]|nr:peptidylprolyl isomerase [Candidatus Methanomethylicia archaeon]MCX8169338.1 peptidylprolyl isomerase [Candidatus Methanomethylicia archaeon]MDW7988879.1 FKBP-type peptidyl-prolyl cis-trans isomerase [Nitrososphaerota archaeon]
MPLNKGDFILLNLTVKVKDTGEIIETTFEKIAKETKIYQESKIYEPILVVLGEGRLLEKVEEEILLMNLGESKVIELEPEKAFGQRDPSKIKVIPARELTSKGISLKPGIKIETDEGLGIVRSIGSGRVIIDLNHPLAGKTLIYEVHVVKKIEDLREKLLALIHRRVPSIDVSKFNLKIENTRLVIELPSEIYSLEDLQRIKRSIVNDIEKHFKNVIKRVEFTEIYDV